MEFGVPISADMGLPSLAWMQDNVTSSKATCVAYLVDNGIIEPPTECVMCESRLSGNIVTGQYRCVRKGCRKSMTLFGGTFFSGAKQVECHRGMLMAYFWLCGDTNQSIRQKMGNFSSVTVNKWIRGFKDLITWDMLQHGEQRKIGGLNIDESKFGKRKYNRGRNVNGHWVVGGIEETPEKNVFAGVDPN